MAQEETLKFEDAVDAATSIADDSVVDDTAPDDEEVVEDEVDDEELDEEVDDDAEVKDDDDDATKEDPDDDAVASELADLSHDDVVHSKAGKGMLAELKKLRDENRSLKAAKGKAKDPDPDDDDDDVIDFDDEEADDDDVDVFTAKDVKKIVEKAVAPLVQQLAGTRKSAQQAAYQRSLAALREEQKAGEIPSTLNPSKVVAATLKDLQANKPGTYADLMASEDPVRAAWQYATAFVPEVNQAILTAKGSRKAVARDRMARGRAVDTGGEPAEFSDLLDVLNGS